jgi:hypothetical protein
MGSRRRAAEMKGPGDNQEEQRVNSMKPCCTFVLFVTSVILCAGCGEKPSPTPAAKSDEPAAKNNADPAKITHENFQKLKEGMSTQQVESILGPWTRTYEHGPLIQITWTTEGKSISVFFDDPDGKGLRARQLEQKGLD